MNRALLTVTETKELIAAGKVLSLAGDESLLRQLPQGKWIGGTIPYFIGDQGGVETKEKLFAAELTDATASAVAIKVYSPETIKNIAKDAPENGYTLLILPAFTSIHAEYANHGRDYEDMFIKPVVGWVSGVHLSEIGKTFPKVFDGSTGLVSTSDAVALHVRLPAEKMAVIHILNLFKQNRAGDVITFPETGFTATTCYVNGKKTLFADYIAENKTDFALPLVADYNGAQINTSFRAVNPANKQVEFYAPVFSGIEYQQAVPVGDYVQEFASLAHGAHEHTQFSCNCILNYVHGKLQGRRMGDLNGPMTFGEIAYQLLNQTLVYLEVRES